MAETPGCQLWGVMGRFLTYKDTTDDELDAIKRRLFGFMDINEGHDLSLQDIRELKTQEEIRAIINEYDPEELAEMFF